MKKNMGNADRALRVIVGVALLSLWFFDPSNLVYLIGLVPLATAFVSYCPLYSVFGFRTIRPKS